MISNQQTCQHFLSYITDKRYVLFWLLMLYLSPFLSYFLLGSNHILVQVLLQTFLLNFSSSLAFMDMHILGSF